MYVIMLVLGSLCVHVGVTEYFLCKKWKFTAHIVSANFQNVFIKFLYVLPASLPCPGTCVCVGHPYVS